MTISLDELKKAVETLKVAIDLYNNSNPTDLLVKNAFRDACIQRFEYCIEMSWKISMKSLGSSTVAAKPAIREMARSNLINNPELWFTFIEARNETSHSYDEEVAVKVFDKIQLFFPEAIKLIIQLENVI